MPIGIAAHPSKDDGWGILLRGDGWASTPLLPNPVKKLRSLETKSPACVANTENGAEVIDFAFRNKWSFVNAISL